MTSIIAPNKYKGLQFLYVLSYLTLFALAIPGREMGDCRNPSSTSMCFIFIMYSSGILHSTEVILINQAADL